MWTTIKIALLAAGITVTAITADSPAYSERCTAAPETAAEMTPVTNAAAASDTHAECLPAR